MSSCRKVFPKTRREVMLALYLKDSSTLLSVSFVVFSFIFRLILIVVSYKSRLFYTPLVYATVQILQANSLNVDNRYPKAIRLRQMNLGRLGSLDALKIGKVARSVALFQLH